MSTKKENIIKQLGRNIQLARKRQNLTQEKLAERSSEVMNANSISVIERGQGNPKLKTLIGISSGLGVSLSELFLNLNQESRKERLDAKTIDYFISVLEELKK